ncbi:MAG: DUF817 domain-containing protein [Parvularculaceae bacterium]
MTAAASTLETKPPRPPVDGEASRVDAVLARRLPPFERALADRSSPDVARGVVEFLVFGVKQAWACLFGGLLLAGILATGLYWPADAPLARYDALFVFAILVQAAFLATGLERPREALVILIFHLVGTAMEVFKTHAGSWTYPEANVLRLGGVPLFSGFMYASVGSYLARVARTFEFRFTRYPNRAATVVLGAAIYANFFTHHFGPDVRLFLFAAAAVLFGRTQVSYRVWRWRHRMPLLLGFALVAAFIWIAENAATFAGVWLYPDQHEGWRPVSWSKMGAWLLLMLISWTLVTLIHPPKREAE